MSERKRLPLDEYLADYTDQILAGKKPGEMTAPDTNLELDKLVKTVSRLVDSLPQGLPDAALRNRIRANLTREWQTKGPPLQRKIHDYHSSRQVNIRIIWSAVLAVLVIIVISIIVAPMIGIELPGAARYPSVVSGIVIGLVMLLALFLWLFRQKRK